MLADDPGQRHVVPIEYQDVFGRVWLPGQIALTELDPVSRRSVHEARSSSVSKKSRARSDSPARPTTRVSAMVVSYRRW